MGQADSERWCMVCMFYDGGVYLCTSVTISTKVLTVGKTCNCNSLSTGPPVGSPRGFVQRGSATAGTESNCTATQSQPAVPQDYYVTLVAQN